MQVEKKCEFQNLNEYEKYKQTDHLNPELKSIIDKIAKKEGFVTYDLIVKNIIPDGGNFLGVLSEVTVQDTLNNKDLHLFVKSIIPNAKEFKLLSIPDAYSKEIQIYSELTKLFENLQADAQVPVEERYNFVKSYSESNTDHIIMENMIKKGYATWNRFDVISLDYAKRAIKLLAKLHALGFVVQEKRPKYFEQNIMPSKYPLNFEEETRKFYKNMASNALEYLEDDAKNKFEAVITSLYERCAKYSKDENSTLTIGHGDFKPSNILIQVDKGEITDMIPIDYQCIYYGSPLMDLFFLIFISTDRKFRRKHLDYLKNLYYDTMKKFLMYFDMNVEKYYPKEEYETLFKERMDYGLFVGVWSLQSILVQEDTIVDFSKVQISDASFGKNDLAKKRTQELFDDFIQWGYL